ncbi:transketolase [Aequitasia blattaphilus]|uniref:Transketolase n=1 Tax=Aequitasia blattaphilus TaxID=2949332 RepID=A0ABT1EEH0_9FIRM|nr:transketolase [Aequitasia blattaphilus]MCP1103337.1 transketolase [Aequitasia blattaphilus]MCR8615977.1 transketolase [Aequitasia blattaphilus]
MSKIDIKRVVELEDKCVKIRKDLLNFIYQIGMGHLGGELSIVEMTVALYYEYMKYDPKNPKMEERDRFVLSKGHCSETLYTIFQDMGMYTMDYMVEHFETLDTAQFGMHSNRKYVPAIEASAGSLGHGLPIAVGMALGARASKASWRTLVLVGDGEMDEGTNWEAIMAAGHYQLGNLVAIVDKNQVQMTGTTAQVMNLDPLDKKLEAFGWDVINIEDGNDMMQVCEALDSLPDSDSQARRKPIFIIANTVKGKGVDFMEGNYKWHGGGIAKEQLEEALKDVEKNRKVR